MLQSQSSIWCGLQYQFVSKKAFLINMVKSTNSKDFISWPKPSSLIRWPRAEWLHLQPQLAQGLWLYIFAECPHERLCCSHSSTPNIVVRQEVEDSICLQLLVILFVFLFFFCFFFVLSFNHSPNRKFAIDKILYLRYKLWMSLCLFCWAVTVMRFRFFFRLFTLKG